MAGWVADYVSDFEKTYRCVRLNVRLHNADGTVTRTQPSLDLLYLPATFIANTTDAINNQACCSLIVKARAVKAYLDEKKYLYIEYPFCPGTANYLAFIAEITNNREIKFIDRVGESLSDFYTHLLT